MKLIREIWALCDRRARIQLSALVLMLLLGAALEAAGMGLVMPFVSAAAAPEVFVQQPWVAWAMDLFGVTNPRDVLIACALLATGANIFKNVYSLSVNALQFRILFDIQSRVARRLFSEYLHTDYSFHLDHNSAQLQNVLNNSVRALVQNALVPMMTTFIEVCVLIAVSAVLIAVDPVATVSVVSLLAVFCGGFYFVMRQRIQLWGRESQTAQAKLIRTVRQAVGGIKETKVLGVEDTFVDEYDENSYRAAQSQRNASFTREMPRSVIESAAFLALIGTVILLLLRGNDIAGVLPTLGLFAMAGVRLIPSFTRIMGAMTATRFASAQVTAIHEDLEHLAQRKLNSRQQISGPEVPFESRIQIEDLRFKYPSASARVLDGIDLTIERGQHVAFVGSSGAGKTTIVDLILGLLTPESGRILVDGRDIAQNVRSWQRQIGYIAQPVHLIDDTVRRNIAYGVEPAKVDEARVWAALREARLEDFVRSKPEGLDATIGEDGVRVSGGQRQRIGIARALYHQPSVLILDEATSALDNQTEREFMQEMKAFRHSKTIITIAHRLSTIMDADRIFFLSGGKLIASGTFDELVAANAEFARMARTAESDVEPIPPRP